jgi:two-component sensor histidine kinase
VQALSRTHMLLAEKGWQQVEFADIVRTHVCPFGGDKIELGGPVVMIPAPSVQPIGLAINELAANAAVHGSLSTGKGRLNIDWIVAGSGVLITWEEKEGPAPAKTPSKGFGNVLLSAVVERQLGGTITRDWRDDGLLLRIELPSLDRVGGDLRARP